jgi:hypothetical protein
MAEGSPRPLDEQIARVDEAIARLQRNVPTPPEPGLRPAANVPFLTCCPLCGSDLEQGRATVHGTFWGFLLVGFSYQHCWFEPASGAGEQVVVPSGGSRRACRCPRCGFVAIKANDA